MTTPSIDGIEVLCPACHAEPGYACTSPRFRGMTVRHHDRFVAACEAMTDTLTATTSALHDIAERLLAEPRTDRWNPWRTVVEDYPDIRVFTNRELPPKTWGLTDGYHIWLCKTLGPNARECTLAHELLHIELDAVVAAGEPGHPDTEARIGRECAARLIPSHALAEVLLSHPDADLRTWARALKVDIPTLEVRLRGIDGLDPPFM